ncbi:DsbA family oxidoreductase [Nafulsella turpanensis]|uniref:DsbA family oxidoreductase n=1 Tax=Nafulsella turpanensis TaxID=1265690 RepID=UPI00034A227A|nr:DsbA family oxidoreductase [Nafulsella turpanensis]
MNKQKIKIDIVSDINCPWCYLGEKRLQKAMAEAGDNFDFEINFKPFELSPNAPAEGEKKEDYFIRNYGKEALQRLDAGNRQLKEMGQAEGAIFNFEKSPVIHNTFNGHRLIWLAEKYGVQEAVANALFESNFTEGKNVNDHEQLKQIGIEHGIPAEKLENFFSTTEGVEEVRAMESWAQRSGINGVPAFIFNDKYMVSGAQPAETLKSVFGQVAPALEEIKTDGPSCGPDGNC